MLELKNVVKTFGDFTALRDLTMTVPSGAVYGLVGPNGAGKSTVLRTICGDYRQDSGEVLLDGKPIYEKPEQKMRIGVIPDEIFYFHSSTVEDMRRFYKSVYPSFDDALFQSLAPVFELPKKGTIRKFSKGMQKQAAFWLTLSCRPELLILDEPVDGLDPVMRREIWSVVMSDVASRGTTVLVSSHNLRELEDVCDHVGIMNKGTMLMEKSLQDMQDDVCKVQFMGECPEGLEILNRTDVGRLTTLILRGSADRVRSIMEQAGISYFDVLPLSLEEIFIYELGGVNRAIREIVL